MARLSALIVFAVSLLVFGSLPAVALDLDGTDWVGTFSCSGVDAAGGKSSTKIPGVTLSISQTGSDAVVTADFGGGGIPYDAKVFNDPKSPDSKGTLAMVHPGTNPDAATFSELIHGPVTYNAATGKGTFKGTAVRMGDPFGAESCKWTFKAVP